MIRDVEYRFFIIRHIHNHTSISSEMQVELKKNTAGKIQVMQNMGFVSTNKQPIY